MFDFHLDPLDIGVIVVDADNSGRSRRLVQVLGTHAPLGDAGHHRA